ncbi:unnamed protein product [Orchesella dallaii]|uniref:Death domain-containing protein n=1 Tax=Orchesella dallaii TaxID=48710 RepID=A0ABP1QA02_9HEXA
MSQNSIEKNLNQLTKLTRNFAEVLEKLQDYDVLTSSEIKQINHCSDEETSIQMLYTMVARKPLSNFDLLLYVLQDTDNEMLAKVLEKSLKSGDESIAREKHLEQQDSFELYASMESGSILISRGEMGIAEILEDYTQLRENWKNLFRMLNLPNSRTNAYKYEDNFVMQATLILRDWSLHLKKNATVENLCRIFENHELHNCSARIHKMFDGYIDSGFAFDFPGTFSIQGKIAVISTLLDNNPSFCFHPERLLLMLNLPLESLSEFVHDDVKFPTIAQKMLTRWSNVNGKSTSTDYLASLLALNGHFHTCGAKGERATDQMPLDSTSTSYASPAHRQQPRQPEYKVVNVKEPPKSYDRSFYCLHTSVEIVVLVSLICATSELVLGVWVLYVLSKTSFHTSSSKYITIGVGMFIAQCVRVYALLTWLKSSKQELTKAYSATTLCTVVSILVLLPIGCLVLFVAVIVFEVVKFHTRPQIEVLQAFVLVAGFDLAFSICYGSIVACCFQNRVQKRQIYLRTSQIIHSPPPAPVTAVSSIRKYDPHRSNPMIAYV